MWTQQSSGIGHSLRALHFLDSKTGFAVGDSGAILATKDGGGSWEMLKSWTDSRLTGIAFINDKEGMITGEDGTILRTIDGGNTWSNIPSGIETHLYTISSSPDGSLYAVGQWGRDRIRFGEIAAHGKQRE